MKKEKLEQEFWDFVAIITLFFVCTVIFAFTKLAPLATVCWIMFLFFASVYPVKWIIQFIFFLIKR
ncbi:TPA: hypothetical protein RZH03_002013, partial [Campylobacter coli]|nr:hypothetical protein [Campylobacter coli]